MTLLLLILIVLLVLGLAHINVGWVATTNALRRYVPVEILSSLCKELIKK